MKKKALQIRLAKTESVKVTILHPLLIYCKIPAGPKETRVERFYLWRDMGMQLMRGQ